MRIGTGFGERLVVFCLTTNSFFTSMLAAKIASVVLVGVFVPNCSTQADQPWRRHTIDASSRGADGVRLADFNGDGRLDIVTGWEEGGVVRMYLHPGAEHCRKVWPGVTVGRGKSPEDAVAVDLDGDGSLDMVSCHEGGFRQVMIHWGPKQSSDDDGDSELLKADNWSSDAVAAASKKSMWMFALPMQVDGRQGIDLIVASKKDGMVGWLESPENPRDPAAWRLHKIVDAGWIMSLIAADMDGDGDDDVLVTDRKGSLRGVYWLEKRLPEDRTDGLPVWQRHDIGLSDGEPMFATVLAARKSMLPEVWVATHNNAIVRFVPSEAQTDWHRSEFTNPFDVGFGKAVAVARDSDRRLIVAHTTEAGAFKVGHKIPAVAWTGIEQADDGQWQAEPWRDVSGLEGVKFDLIHWIDIDGDGDLDLLTCEERDNLGVVWYENRQG